MLDDAQLRTLEERLRYLRELEERRTAILDSVREQGKLTEELEARASAGRRPRPAWRTSTRRTSPSGVPRRRSRVGAGLEPLAEGLLGDPSVDPLAAASAFVDAGKGVADPQAALDGARSILTEKFSGGRRPDRRAAGADVGARAARRQGEGGQGGGRRKFADYLDFAEPFTELPSHRILAMLRGERRTCSTSSWSPRRPPTDPRRRGDRREPLRDRRPRPARRQVAHGHGPLGLAHPHPWCTWASTCGCGCTAAEGRGGERLRHRTSATCCWPPRRAPVRRSAWTRASVRA